MMRIVRDTNEVNGYEEDAKTSDNKRGYCFNIAIEKDGGLRVYTDGNYRYLTVWQTKQVIKKLNKLLKK